MLENKEKVLITEQDIINTYSEKDQLSCKKHKEYLKLVKQNPKIGYKRAAKLLGVKQGSTRWWHTKGKKRAVPNPLKTCKKLKEHSFLPFQSTHPDFTEILRMMGVIIGDGNIDCRLNSLSFISSDFRDITLWKKELVRIFPFIKNKISIIEGGEYGHSYCIRTFDRSVIRFFIALGTPVGNKVRTAFQIPKYLFELSNKQKTAFLDGLFSAEIAVPVYRADSRFPNNYRFTNFQFGMNKIESLTNDHKHFLEDIKKLSAEIGVTCTPNLRKEVGSFRVSKSGIISHNYRIFFQTRFHKIVEFDMKFSLKYAVAKKEKLEKKVKKALLHKKKHPSRENIFNRFCDQDSHYDFSFPLYLRKTSFQDIQKTLSGARV
jgi:Lon-like ATP-dependent protease